jgi:uncharacterized HAD superfamily protein
MADTVEALTRNNFEYDEIIFDADVNKKAAICKKNKIDVFVDDSVATCQLIAESGTRALLFVTNFNRGAQLSNEVDKVKNWEMLYQMLKG